MLSSTIELITMVASDSLLVFLVCNFIIVVIFVASSLQTSHISENRPFVSTPQFDDSYSQRISRNMNASYMGTNCIHIAQKNDGESESLSVKIEEPDLDVSISGSFSVEESKTQETEKEECQWKIEEEDEDELQRRAEEFIKKLKQHWMEEKFGKYVL